MVSLTTVWSTASSTASSSTASVQQMLQNTEQRKRWTELGPIFSEFASGRDCTTYLRPFLEGLDDDESWFGWTNVSGRKYSPLDYVV